MVSKSSFYTNVKVHLDENHPLGQRIQSLIDNVVERLPDEEQFQIRGMIGFNLREESLDYWNHMKNLVPIVPDFMPADRDGNCTYSIQETIENSFFIITIIVDDLDERSDEYIKGLIAHEISEWSYAWITVKKELPRLKKLKPRAKEVMLNRILKQDYPIGSKEHQEHEDTVNQEAIRLGFENEIRELKKSK